MYYPARSTKGLVEGANIKTPSLVDTLGRCSWNYIILGRPRKNNSAGFGF